MVMETLMFHRQFFTISHTTLGNYPRFKEISLKCGNLGM